MRSPSLVNLFHREADRLDPAPSWKSQQNWVDDSACESSIDNYGLPRNEGSRRRNHEEHDLDDVVCRGQSPKRGPADDPSLGLIVQLTDHSALEVTRCDRVYP